MNEHNPGDVAARTSYYGVRGVPRSVLDGVSQGPPNTAITNATIDARYNVPSPFTMELSATNTTSLDHIDVHVKITASQDFSGVTNAKIAVV